LIKNRMGLVCCKCCCVADEEAIPLSDRELQKRDSSNLTGAFIPGNEVNGDTIQGKKLFNKNPKEGIRFFQQKNLLGASPQEVAAFLRETTFLDKTMIGDYLGDKKDFNMQVLDCYVRSIDFTNMKFDEALRKFLGFGFRLPGEAQKIDRIMEKFACNYLDQNPKTFDSPAVAYVLAFSLIMLNTDLHNPNNKQKMTKEAFIKNNKGTNHGHDFPREYLEELYDSFKTKELEFAEGLRLDDTTYTFYRPEKRGYLLKLGSNGISWNKRYFLLSNNCLYYFLHEDDKDPRGIIPLEDIEVKELEAQLDLEEKFCFQIWDPAATLKSQKSMKSVKFKNGDVIQGGRLSYIFGCDTAEEREEWMQAISLNTATSSIPQLMQDKLSTMKKMMPEGSGGVASGSKLKKKESNATLLINEASLENENDFQAADDAESNSPPMSLRPIAKPLLPPSPPLSSSSDSSVSPITSSLKAGTIEMSPQKSRSEMPASLMGVFQNPRNSALLTHSDPRDPSPRPFISSLSPSTSYAPSLPQTSIPTITPAIESLQPENLFSQSAQEQQLLQPTERQVWSSQPPRTRRRRGKGRSKSEEGPFFLEDDSEIEIFKKNALALRPIILDNPFKMPLQTQEETQENNGQSANTEESIPKNPEKEISGGQSNLAQDPSGALLLSSSGNLPLPSASSPFRPPLRQLSRKTLQDPAMRTPSNSFYKLSYRSNLSLDLAGQYREDTEGEGRKLRKRGFSEANMSLNQNQNVLYFPEGGSLDAILDFEYSRSPTSKATRYQQFVS